MPLVFERVGLTEGSFVCRLCLMTGVTVLVLTSFLLTPSYALSLQDRSEEIERTPDGIIITLEFPSPEMKEVSRDGETFLQILLPGCGYQRSVGKPLLPVLKKFVEVPGEMNPTLRTEILVEEEMRIPYPVLPAQPPVQKSSGSSSRFIYDREFYGTSGWTPPEVCTIEKIGIIRKHRVAIVKVCPVKYLPSEGKLAIIRSLKVSLEFDDGRGMEYPEGLIRHFSPPLERSFRAAVENFRSKKSLHSEVGYLIIAGDDLAGHLLPLIEWKRRKGFHTTLMTLSDISTAPAVIPTAEEIRASIRDAYENWDIPPSYVLLVGDVNSITSWTGDYSYKPTDLYYSTMDDDDIFPDLHIGRLSVETPEEASSAVEKIIDYERNDWKYGGAWLERAYFIASDDPTYHQVAESTHTYCMQIARRNGMLCDSLWGYYETGTPVDTAFDQGRSMVVYSGHGSVDEWDGPKFSTSDVESLRNTDKYPFVLSHACLTGFYPSECFGEVLTRGDSSGALAFFGSSGPTYWGEDDLFQRGIFDAVFSDSLHTLGEVIEYARLHLLSLIDTLWAYEYYEIYNLLGDPSLDTYTDSPHPIVVIHPDTIPAGPYVLEVEVRDSALWVDRALVSCTADRIWTAYTDSSGIARVELEASSGDTVRITVTGHNLRPYESHMVATYVDVAESRGRPADFALFQNYPNPFREATSIRYRASEKGALTLEIYDSAGRILMHRSERAIPGYQVFRWDGRNSTGKSVSSGIYFYRLKMDGKCLTKKMALIR